MQAYCVKCRAKKEMKDDLKPFQSYIQALQKELAIGNCQSSAFMTQPGNGHFSQLNHPCENYSSGGSYDEV